MSRKSLLQKYPAGAKAGLVHRNNQKSGRLRQNDWTNMQSTGPGIAVNHRPGFTGLLNKQPELRPEGVPTYSGSNENPGISGHCIRLASPQQFRPTLRLDLQATYNEQAVYRLCQFA